MFYHEAPTRAFAHRGKMPAGEIRAKKQLMEHLSAPMMIEGKEVKAVEELKWYPGGLAYRLGCDRRFIRKQPNLVKTLGGLDTIGAEGEKGGRGGGCFS